ncbi:mechanosensitive ion channel domain-containing protein [Mariniblastus fucicola]|uniref:Small-conductance mechanosensitive channel n=1 Tax=Mariniblastus fucicola TaxID=980251 RepID=A0A5B9PHX4_9BACT|nr:mechanosensitive ion channel domain-containing protein [Mariniblastus fucicola]QEG24900.1 Small-conductance mechanosensitive channel [Mariniblastus fucicola]
MRPRNIMFQMTLVILLSMMMANASIAQDDGSGGSEESNDAVATTPNTVAVEDVADDSKIVQRLQGILESSGWFEEVEVTSQNGFVNINGFAISDENSDWATEIASRTTDVIGVSNNLEVKSRIDFGQSMSVVGKSLDKLYRDFLLRVPFIIAGIVVIALTWIVSRLFAFVFSRVLENRETIRASLRDLIKQLASISIWVVGFLIATVVVFPGMTPARALAVLGLGSVAIGFAFKDIFENFFAGVLILWRYPIEKGDFIQNGDVVGKVEEITIRNTMLRRTDGELVVIPNGQLFKSNVEVLTNRPKRRVRINCGVGYGEDVDRSREVIRNAVADCESISGPKSVEVFASEFADSSINFEVAWWTGAAPLEIRKSRDEVIAAIKSALDNANIEIPFPYRTLTFADSLRVEDRVSKNDDALEVSAARS